jgi:hypothetical protein
MYSYFRLCPFDASINSRPFRFVLRALRSSPVWAVSTLTLTRGIVVQKTAKVTVNEPDNFTVYKILKNFKISSNYPDELVGIDEDKHVYFLYWCFRTLSTASGIEITPHQAPHSPNLIPSPKTKKFQPKKIKKWEIKYPEWTQDRRRQCGFCGSNTVPPDKMSDPEVDFSLALSQVS